MKVHILGEQLNVVRKKSTFAYVLDCLWSKFMKNPQFLLTWYIMLAMLIWILFLDSLVDSWSLNLKTPYDMTLHVNSDL